MVQRHKHGRDGNVVPLNRWTGSPAGLRTGADSIFTAFILELLINLSFLHLLPSLFILIVFRGVQKRCWMGFILVRSDLLYGTNKNPGGTSAATVLLHLGQRNQRKGRKGPCCSCQEVKPLGCCISPPNSSVLPPDLRTFGDHLPVS